MKQEFNEIKVARSYAQYKKDIKRDLAGKSGIIGIVHVEKFDKDGNKVFETFSHNLVTTVGDGWCVGKCVATGNAMGYMAIGIDNDPAPAKADTTLNSEVSGSRGAEDSTYPKQGSGGDANDFIHRKTFTGITQNGVVEVGIFDAGTGGNMLDRSIFSSVNLTSVDSLQVTVTITFLGA